MTLLLVWSATSNGGSSKASSFPEFFVFVSLCSFIVQQLRLVTRLRSIKFFSLLFGIYAITSRWVWYSYPWAIKNIQDGCCKTGQICDGDVISGKKHETSILGFWSMAFSNFMGKICSDHDITLKCTLKYIGH